MNFINYDYLISALGWKKADIFLEFPDFLDTTV